MDVEVAVPPPLAAAEFHFDSTSSSPFITAPSTPQRFGNFFRHPTAPTAADLSSSIPFDWEQKPGTPKNRAGESSDLDGRDDEGDYDFEFDFSGQLERSSLSAEELFDGGKIRPLKPPPGYEHLSGALSPRSPKSPRYRVSKKKEFDPFEAALEQTRKSVELEGKPILLTRQRGRHRTSSGSSSSSSTYVHKGSRSLSPLRVAGILGEVEQDQPPRVSVRETSSTSNSSKSYASSFFSSLSFSKSRRKWSFKDLLYRSASEGRASDKDPLAKYALLSRKAEEVKNSSFRSTESGGSFSRRRGRVSAHELHYAANRALAEEMKRKTFLPYKQGLLGCLGFSPGGCGHEVSRGIGSMTRGI